ncbi:MAG: hypothetical protein U0174_20825 [Polyangiaceae bacterium]
MQTAPSSLRAAATLLLASLLAFACTATTEGSSGSSGASDPACNADNECELQKSTCCGCLDTAVKVGTPSPLGTKCMAVDCAANSCADESRLALCESNACAYKHEKNLNPSEFDQSCSAPEDCVVVSTRFSCNCAGPAPDFSAAINGKAKAAFDAARTERFKNMRCPNMPGPCAAGSMVAPRATCTAGKCEVVKP